MKVLKNIAEREREPISGTNRTGALHAIMCTQISDRSAENRFSFASHRSWPRVLDNVLDNLLACCEPALLFSETTHDKRAAPNEGSPVVVNEHAERACSLASALAFRDHHFVEVRMKQTSTLRVVCKSRYCPPSTTASIRGYLPIKFRRKSRNEW